MIVTLFVFRYVAGWCYICLTPPLPHYRHSIPRNNKLRVEFDLVNNWISQKGKTETSRRHRYFSWSTFGNNCGLYKPSQAQSEWTGNMAFICLFESVVKKERSWILAWCESSVKLIQVLSSELLCNLANFLPDSVQLRPGFTENGIRVLHTVKQDTKPCVNTVNVCQPKLLSSKEIKVISEVKHSEVNILS